jgi:hypothetical protein
MSIGAGYACVGCQTYLRPRKNEIVVLETFGDGVKPYKVWLADLWECPDCACQIIFGYGAQPVSKYYQNNFDTWLSRVTHTIKGCPRSLD